EREPNFRSRCLHRGVAFDAHGIPREPAERSPQEWSACRGGPVSGSRPAFRSLFRFTISVRLSFPRLPRSASDGPEVRIMTRLYRGAILAPRTRSISSEKRERLVFRTPAPKLTVPGVGDDPSSHLPT